MNYIYNIIIWLNNLFLKTKILIKNYDEISFNFLYINNKLIIDDYNN